MVSEAVFPVEDQRQKSIEVQLQLKSLDESLPSNGKIFEPSLSVAVDGITTNAHEGEKFTMLGEFTNHSYSMSGHLNYENTIMSAASAAEITSYPKTIESMIVASRKGVDFFVVILTWQPIDEVNRSVGREASGI